MLSGALALTTAATFTGAAVYVTVAEQPARLELETSAALRQWKPSYSRGFALQASLALAGALFGLLAWWSSRDWRWMIGAALIFANWPYTLIVILPVNKLLEATAPDKTSDKTRGLLVTWGRLHSMRSVLGFVATLIFLWAAG